MIVIVGTAGQLIINELLGNTFNGTLFLTQLGSFLPLLIIGPLSEEIGWRGYALGRLQTRWNALVSSLIVGLVWALWHLPLFMMVGTSQHELGVPFISFLIKMTASSILYTWLYNNTQQRSLVSGPASLDIYLCCPGVIFRDNAVSSLQQAGLFTICDHGSLRSFDLETTNVEQTADISLNLTQTLEQVGASKMYNHF